jgi:hypothetical protein
MHVSRRSLLIVSLVAAAAAGAGCDRGAQQPTLTIGPATPMESPAGAGSSEPNLTVGPDGRVYLTWQEAMNGAHELRFAILDGEQWSEARPIARGTDWFVNWADFPTLVVLPDGRLAAHYLRRHPTGERYHYDVEIVQSSDAGASWSQPVRPHRDGVPAEHGFVSLFPDEGGRLGVVWLDGRKYDASFGGTEEMMLKHTTLAADGSLGSETPIDERVCDCCQTAWALTSRGPVVVYRDRSPEEIRDIYIARRSGEGWITAPVHDDGWEIAACPVNGPAVAADGDRVVVAWFTAAHDSPRVRVAFSDDAGTSFSAPIDVDGGNPAGRVDVVMIGGGRAVVSWLERGDEGAAEVRTRVVSSAGAGESQLVARSTEARGSGFPRMTRSGDRLIFAWTDAADGSRVRIARAHLEEAP